jgi:DNA-directed RNA polymerase specialized sigma24 family protein
MGNHSAGTLRSQCSLNKTSIEDEIEPVLKNTLHRIHSWPVPYNWSRRDWHSETENLATAAAWQAAADYIPPRELAFSCFVHQRVISCLRTRYRQEFLYGIRFSIELTSTDTDSDSNSPHESTQPPPDSDPAVNQFACFDIVEALSRLSIEQRHLIEQIFWFGHTETHLADALGISQVAVNKRKQAALRTLRGFLRET